MTRVKILFALPLLAMAACGSSEDEHAGRAADFEHVANISRQYADSILSLDPESMEMQQILLHVNAGSERLKQQGDTALADYFREVIATDVAERNPALARRLFPAAPLWE